jgi:hypothetical protein
MSMLPEHLKTPAERRETRERKATERHRGWDRDHRHAFDVVGRQPEGAIRTCKACSVRQEKIHGRWVTLPTPRQVPGAPRAA